MESFFIIICFVLVLSIVVFLLGLIMLIFSKTEENKKIATKLLISSVIAFIIGFGTCFAAITIGA